jgi:hypothetical protein
LLRESKELEILRDRYGGIHLQILYIEFFQVRKEKFFPFGNVKTFALRINGRPKVNFFFFCFSYYPQTSVQSINYACSAWLDGQPVIQDYACIGQNANGQLGLGNNPNATSQYFTGDLAELLIYNRILQTTERQNVEEYLQSKWNLPFSYQG